MLRRPRTSPLPSVLAIVEQRMELVVIVRFECAEETWPIPKTCPASCVPTERMSYRFEQLLVGEFVKS